MPPRFLHKENGDFAGQMIREWYYEYDEGNKYLADVYEYYCEESYRETYYLPDGMVFYDQYYYDGRFMTGGKDFHENGTLRYEYDEDNATGWEKCYFEDGGLMAEAYKREDGTGVRYISYANGNLQEEHRQAADASYWMKSYYENGALQKEYRYEWVEEVFCACYDQEGSLIENRGEAA